MNLTASFVADTVEGALYGADHPILSITTDSRNVNEGALFVALRGPTYDGHAFIEAAASAGCVAAMVEADRVQQARASGLVTITVEDTLRGLGRLANALRRRSSAKIIGLTGSSGKTSTKAICAAMLSAHGLRTHATPGNLNNEVGVPLTLFGLEQEHEFGVIEMGMNARGEIERLTRIVEPDVGLLINIGWAHVGELGSIEEVARAKGELFESAPAGCLLVANADDHRVMERLAASGRNATTFGTSDAADVVLEGRIQDASGGQRVRLRSSGRETEIRIPWAGAHHAMNVAAAAAAIGAAGVQLRESVTLDLDPPRGRGSVHVVGAWHVVDESYNANADSVIAALEAVVERASGAPTALLLGAMNELGPFSVDEHARVGRRAAQLGVRLVAAFGAGAEPTADAASRGGVEASFQAEDDSALWSWLRERLDGGRWWILVKGSRASGMERFLRRFEEG